MEIAESNRAGRAWRGTWRHWQGSMLLQTLLGTRRQAA